MLNELVSKIEINEREIVKLKAPAIAGAFS